MQQDKILSMLGLAAKAGKIASGEFSTEKAVKSHQAFLVIISAEASENTKKKFRNMCAFYEVPIFCYGTKDALGAAVGCEFRASIAVTDAGLSQSLEKKIVSMRDGGYENGKNQSS